MLCVQVKKKRALSPEEETTLDTTISIIKHKENHYEIED
jgi:hypothetical protein